MLQSTRHPSLHAWYSLINVNPIPYCCFSKTLWHPSINLCKLRGPNSRWWAIDSNHHFYPLSHVNMPSDVAGVILAWSQAANCLIQCMSVHWEESLHFLISSMCKRHISSTSTSWVLNFIEWYFRGPGLFLHQKKDKYLISSNSTRSFKNYFEKV